MCDSVGVKKKKEHHTYHFSVELGRIATLSIFARHEDLRILTLLIKSNAGTDQLLREQVSIVLNLHSFLVVPRILILKLHK